MYFHALSKADLYNMYQDAINC